MAASVAWRTLAAVLVATAFGCGHAAAEDVPLPLPRPSQADWSVPLSFRAAAGPNFDSAAVSADPTACDYRLAAVALIEPVPRLIGPGDCGGGDMVQLDQVVLADGARVDIKPAPVLRCEMAESLAGWLREDAGPRLAKLGAALRAVENYDDYECRTRNRIFGAKPSDHGKGIAIDIRSFTLADGRRIGVTDPAVSKDLRTALRDSACARFSTVLGPGAAYHENHVHLDTDTHWKAICRWEVREPPATTLVSVRQTIDSVPLPPPRPAIADVANSRPGNI